MTNTRDNYWGEIYDTITKHNDHNHKPLYNVNIRETIDKVMREEKVVTNNIMVDKFIPQRNDSENLINKVKHLKIYNVGKI